MSKCSKIYEAWASGDRIGALRIAARFFDRSLDTQIFRGRQLLKFSFAGRLQGCWCSCSRAAACATVNC